MTEENSKNSAAISFWNKNIENKETRKKCFKTIVYKNKEKLNCFIMRIQ